MPGASAGCQGPDVRVEGRLRQLAPGDGSACTQARMDHDGRRWTWMDGAREDVREITTASSASSASQPRLRLAARRSLAVLPSMSGWPRSWVAVRTRQSAARAVPRGQVCAERQDPDFPGPSKVLPTNLAHRFTPLRDHDSALARDHDAPGCIIADHDRGRNESTLANRRVQRCAVAARSSRSGTFRGTR